MENGASRPLKEAGLFYLNIRSFLNLRSREENGGRRTLCVERAEREGSLSVFRWMDEKLLFD